MKKIHVCCGGVYLNGYVNIDKYPFEPGDDSRSGCVADVIADVFDLPYAKGSISEIVLVHGMEHFTRYDGVRLLQKFADLLTSDGVIYLEMPSRNPVFILLIVERLIAPFAFKFKNKNFGRGLASSMLWGNQWAGFDYETHRYLWSVSEIRMVSKKLGLTRSEVFRYPSSHIPFRDVGIALSASASVRSYRPPKIRREARKGFIGNVMGIASAFLNVIIFMFKNHNKNS